MDLFAEWRAACDRGEFSRSHLAPAVIFETWIETCGFDPSKLTPEQFETFLSYLASLGHAAQRLRQIEILLRTLYLWALKRRLVSKLPFSDSLLARSTNVPPRITTDEVHQLWQWSLKQARNQEISFTSRLKNARGALAIGLIYLVGYPTASLKRLTWAELAKLVAGDAVIQRELAPTILVYRETLGEMGHDELVFLAPRLGTEVDRGRFGSDIKVVALTSSIPNPERFTPLEIKRRHKEDGGRSGAIGTALAERGDAKETKVRRHWSAVDVTQLLSLHPREQQELPEL